MSYNCFKSWCEKHGAKEVTENVLLAYFVEKSEHLKSSTLYAEYSKLKTSLAVKEETNIKVFTKLKDFLKKKSIGYRADKSRIFSRNQINKFLLEAPDEKYLLMKVALIFGIAGACRTHEFVQMTVDHIEDKGTTLMVNIPQMRANRKRSFVVDNVRAEVNMIEIYRKYAALRPTHTDHRRFFMSYRRGRCLNQVVGVHAFGKIPGEVAKFLKLESPPSYTGHCYRRTSDYLKRSGGWLAVTMTEYHFAEDGAEEHEIETDEDVRMEEMSIKVEEQDVKDVKM